MPAEISTGPHTNTDDLIAALAEDLTVRWPLNGVLGIAALVGALGDEGQRASGHVGGESGPKIARHPTSRSGTGFDAKAGEPHLIFCAVLALIADSTRSSAIELRPSISKRQRRSPWTPGGSCITPELSGRGAS